MQMLHPEEIRNCLLESVRWLSLLMTVCSSHHPYVLIHQRPASGLRLRMQVSLMLLLKLV